MSRLIRPSVAVVVCAVVALSLASPSLAAVGHSSTTNAPSVRAQASASANGSAAAHDPLTIEQRLRILGVRGSGVAVRSTPADGSDPPPFDLPDGSAATLTACAEVPDGRCGRLALPLDRRNPARAGVSLFFQPRPVHLTISAT